MSEYQFVSTYQSRPVHVRMGWSRALQRHYLIIQYTDGNEGMVYSHADDPDVSRYTELGYFVKKLIGLGLAVPKAAVRGLTTAPWRDGTAIRAHDAQRFMRDTWRKSPSNTETIRTQSPRTSRAASSR